MRHLLWGRHHCLWCRWFLHHLLWHDLYQIHLQWSFSLRYCYIMPKQFHHLHLSSPESRKDILLTSATPEAQIQEDDAPLASCWGMIQIWTIDLLINQQLVPLEILKLNGGSKSWTNGLKQSTTTPLHHLMSLTLHHLSIMK